jgi:hypothetical protein
MFERAAVFGHAIASLEGRAPATGFSAGGSGQKTSSFGRIVAKRYWGFGSSGDFKPGFGGAAVRAI